MNLLKLVLITLLALVFQDYIRGIEDIIFIVDTSLNKWEEVLI